MARELKDTNAVIVGPQFNPPIFTQTWVAGQLVVPDEDFEPLGMVYSPILANYPTREFSLLVLPGRLQFTPRVEQQREGRFVRDKIDRILNSVAHGPFAAIGLNLVWALRSEGQANNAVTQKLFFSETHWLSREFAAPDACFGAYCSKDCFGFRLKLDIRPVTEVTPGQGGDHVLFNFNYHQDLSG
ncbi:MAG TPA: hypothetical protein VG013_30515, partial [Gemmataceae bacterium]|nr:hypothetical protein [Gemmataceae bacterium]